MLAPTLALNGCLWYDDFGDTRMKTVSITDVRQDATKLVDEVRSSGQPLLVIQRSKPAAYLVASEKYEEMEAELRRLRHEAFWHGVHEATEEYRRGEAKVYDDVEELIADLGLER